MKKLLAVLIAVVTLCAPALCQSGFVTLTGTLQSSNGMPASNYVISFTPSQFGYVAGTAVIINTSTTCATSVDGSVVGVPNPLQAPQVSVSFTGTLPPANYFVKIAWYDLAGNNTLAGPEAQIQLSATGRVIVAPPLAGLPSGAAGMRVFIANSSGAELLQGSTVGTAAFVQSVPLAVGAGIPPTNVTLCKQIANDVIWPTGTGYTVSMTDPSGNTIPGYPMQWQLMGAGSTINLSQGLPYYHGTVYFPTPILSSPLNHQVQSIAGPLSLSGYNLTNVGAIGFGVFNPAWPIDVRNGAINVSGGYIFNGGAGVSTGNCLLADSDSFHTFRVPTACPTLAAANVFTQAQTAPQWINSGTKPTAVYSAGSGNTGSANSAITGTQTDGNITFTTGASPSASSTIITVTLPKAYPTAVYCTATAQNTATAGTFTINSTGSNNLFILNSVGTLPSASSFQVYWHCGGN